MSTPRALTLASRVRLHDLTTDRGTFATLTCSPQASSLPHGNVLLIPGFTGSKEDFATLLPLLAEAGWNAATYDQRGQFESAAEPTDDFSLAGLAADAISVAAALHGTNERVHLVGHSFGGLVAATAAIENPDRWASVTLLCSGQGGFTGATAERLLAAADIVENDGLEAGYHFKYDDDDRVVAPITPEIEKFLHKRFLSNSPGSLAAMARQLADAPDRTTDLAALDLPIAVMRGENDDAWPHDVQDRLAAHLDTHVVVIGASAHSPAVENPEWTRDALSRFWLS